MHPQEAQDFSGFTIRSKENSYAVEGETQTLGPDSVHLSLASGNLHCGFGDPATPWLRVNHRAEIESNYDLNGFRSWIACSRKLSELEVGIYSCPCRSAFFSAAM
jgi:hypothetical protein